MLPPLVLCIRPSCDQSSHCPWARIASPVGQPRTTSGVPPVLDPCTTAC